jgi:predicted PurR-regulated permease PerM
MGIQGILIFPLLIAILVTYLLSPLVNYLEKQKLRRAKGIAIVYIFFLTLFTVIGFSIVPVLIREMQELMLSLPELTEKLMLLVEQLESVYRRFNFPVAIRKALDENIAELQNLLTLNLEAFTQFLVTLFSQTFALLLVPLFAYYILRDSAFFKKRFLRFIPPGYRLNMENTLHEINLTLGAYLRGIFINSLSVGVMIYLGLLILGVKFALFLGILNALTNVIPYFGPLIGAVPVAIIAFLQDPSLVWKVIVLSVVAQQIEGQYIAPQVFGRSLELHPLTVIIALLLGGLYLGFLGLIIVIPLLAILRIFVRHFYPVVALALKEKRQQAIKKDDQQ